MAIQHYTLRGNFRRAATHQQNLAELLELEIGDMKKAIATAKPVAIPGDQYMITWHARGNEYSLYFKKHGNSWVLFALSEGPP